MGTVGKIAIVLVVAVAAVAVVTIKRSGASPVSPQTDAQAAGGLPRLVDLGSTTCIPCKMMAPILEELAKEFAGRLQVDFINVNENPDAAQPFGIQLIPTQVFLDASGKELWRHEGFFSKDEILAKWQELGVDLPASPGTAEPASSDVPVKSGST